MAKFRKFQRPVDFEPKLTHVKRVLDEIEERIHLIELRSEDPDIIQGQLDQCMVGSILKCIAQFFFFAQFYKKHVMSKYMLNILITGSCFVVWLL